MTKWTKCLFIFTFLILIACAWVFSKQRRQMQGLDFEIIQLNNVINSHQHYIGVLIDHLRTLSYKVEILEHIECDVECN